MTAKDWERLARSPGVQHHKPDRKASIEHVRKVCNSVSFREVTRLADVLRKDRRDEDGD